MYPAAQSIVLRRRTSRRARRERHPVVEDSTTVRNFRPRITLPFVGNLPDVPFQVSLLLF